MPWPWKPTYRQFSEFDNLSGHVAHRAVNRLVGRRRIIVGESLCIGIGVGILASLASMYVLGIAMSGMLVLLGEELLALLVISLALVFGMLVGYLAAGRYYHRKMKRALAQRLLSVRPGPARIGRCNVCAYPLLGLPVSSDAMFTCPECGTLNPAWEGQKQGGFLNIG